MNRPVYWGLGVLIVLFIGAFVFVMVNQHAENKQIEAELKEAQRKLDAHNKTANTPEVVEVSDEKPPVNRDLYGFGMATIGIKCRFKLLKFLTPLMTSPLTDHASLLKTYPVKALRLQSEARGHWSAEWIPPFPPDDTEAAEIAKAVYIWVDYYRIKGKPDKEPRPPEIIHVEQVMSDFDKKFWETFDPDQRADPRTCDLLKLIWARRDEPQYRAFMWPSTFDK